MASALAGRCDLDPRGRGRAIHPDPDLNLIDVAADNLANEHDTAPPMLLFMQRWQIK